MRRLFPSTQFIGSGLKPLLPPQLRKLSQSESLSQELRVRAQRPRFALYLWLKLWLVIVLLIIQAAFRNEELPIPNIKGTQNKPIKFLFVFFMALHSIWIVVNFWPFCWSNLILTHFALLFGGFSGCSTGKESALNAGDLGSIPGLGSSPGEGNGNPLQYSVQRIPWTTVNEVTKSWKQLSHFHLVMLWGSDLWSYLFCCFN